MLVGQRRRLLKYLQKKDLEGYRALDPGARPAPVSVIAAGPAGAGLHAGDARTAATFTRDDLEGQTTVLVFYPFAFSPVCTDQFNIYEEVSRSSTARGAKLYGVSCDATCRRGLQGAARRHDPAAVGLRAQGRGVPGVRRLPTRAGSPSARS